MREFIRVLSLIAPHWKGMLGAAVLGFLTVASNIGLMAVSAYLISRAALHPPVLHLMVPIVGVRFFGISRAVFRYLERYFSHNVTFRVLSQLRVRFYRAIEPLAPAGLIQHRSGDLLTRIVADVETLQNFFLRILAPPVVAGLTLVVVFAILTRFEHKLAYTFASCFLAAGIALPLGVRALSRGAGRRAVEIRGALNANLVDSIKGITDILASGQHERQQDRVEVLDRELQGIQGRMAGIAGLSNAMTGLAANLAMWSVLVLAIPLVARGTLDGIYLAMLGLMVLSSFEAVVPLPQALRHLEEGLQAARRLFTIIDAEPAVADSAFALSQGASVRDNPDPSDKPERNVVQMEDVLQMGNALQIEGLRFRYSPEDPWTLDGLKLTLPEGGRLAVVGPSGAGKSTLVSLLLRFWDYEEGSIRLGGHELKAYSAEDLRQMIGVVTQHTHLFNATIRQNLLLAMPEASEEEMIRAARDAQIHPFIEGLPQGYDTYVGEGGLKLSGGQRQRLAIARVLLKNAPVLVLDEATAGLDPVTEKEVMQAICRLMEGRTTLVITHRLAGLEVMDEILVLKAGRLVERGTNEALLQRRGFYHRMWELQHQVLKGMRRSNLNSSPCNGK